MEEYSIVQCIPSQGRFWACVDTVWQPSMIKTLKILKIYLVKSHVRDANSKPGIKRAVQLSSMVGIFYKMHTLWRESESFRPNSESKHL